MKVPCLQHLWCMKGLCDASLLHVNVLWLYPVPEVLYDIPHQQYVTVDRVNPAHPCSLGRSPWLCEVLTADSGLLHTCLCAFAVSLPCLHAPCWHPMPTRCSFGEISSISVAEICFMPCCHVVELRFPLGKPDS